MLTLTMNLPCHLPEKPGVSIYENTTINKVFHLVSYDVLSTSKISQFAKSYKLLTPDAPAINQPH